MDCRQGDNYAELGILNKEKRSGVICEGLKHPLASSCGILPSIQPVVLEFSNSFTKFKC